MLSLQKDYAMKATDKKLWLPLAGGALIILGSFWSVFKDQDISDNISDWSYFGAYVGGCFGIVSVILIYLTFREQSRMAYKSQFESVLFEMLRTLREIKTEEIDNEFANIQGNVLNHFRTPFSKEDFNNEDAKMVLAYYFQLHTESDIIYHYFRYLYHIVKYVCDDDILDREMKNKYMALIQAQMSNDDLLIVLLNAINYGNIKYLNQLDEYHFFENIRPVNDIIDYIIITSFPKTKFKHLIDPTKDNDVIYDFDFDGMVHYKEQYSETIDRLKKERLARQQSES